MDRQASVLMADDMAVSVVQKITLTGIYTKDIIIPIEPYMAEQFVFLFSLETDVSNPFQQIQLQITFPKQEPVAINVPPPSVSDLPEGHNRLVVRQPFLIQRSLLCPGQILAKVTHENGEIEIRSLPWISLQQQPVQSTPPNPDSPKE
jgi:hypothetical protein